MEQACIPGSFRAWLVKMPWSLHARQRGTTERDSRNNGVKGRRMELWPQNPTSTASCTEYLCSPYGKGQVYQICTPKYQLQVRARIVIWQTVSLPVEKPEEWQPSRCRLAGCLCRRLPSMYEGLWNGLFTVYYPLCKTAWRRRRDKSLGVDPSGSEVKGDILALWASVKTLISSSLIPPQHWFVRDTVWLIQ